MRILLTNDDGINAPGLATLERIAAELSDDVWVVAPETEQSGASHSLTLHVPLRMREISPRRFAVQGTPTDSVVMAVKQVLKDKPADLLLSGVNRGSNMADDVTYSGTVAGAMEGTVLGIPSIALSLPYGFGAGSAPRWETPERHGAGLVRQLLEAGWADDVLLNINFPDVAPEAVKGVRATVQGARDQNMLMVDARIDARGQPYYWLGFERRMSNPPEGTDLHAIYNGFISVTPLHMNLTQDAGMPALRAVLAQKALKP